ncbi:tryptophan synthase subunit beta like protein [Balneatrix alpica]|uniref:tryptophan synthase subunit beta like protein n=1 Tax=Balneatrix alpica TaxID=75684 RepID=UPI002738AEE3|nr:tryptophan synthase subunit beta like protein [Balneatrix alpica]
MPYVERDASGAIVAVYATAQSQANEQVDPYSPELKSFLHQDVDSTQRLLRQSDLELQRVLEDVIDLLIDKGVLMFTELPSEAQKKLVSRKRIRTVLKNKGGILGGDDEDSLPL